MKTSHKLIRLAAIAALAHLLLAGSAMNPASAQDNRSSPGLFDNLFNRGEPSQPRQANPPPRDAGPADPSDMSVRLDRMENALRQLTGTLEQLQYQNQQLQMQIQRMQSGAVAPNVVPGAAPVAPGAAPNVSPGVPGALQTPKPGNRSDVFDPSQSPNAPGAPRTLGNPAAIAAPQPNMAQAPTQYPAQNARQNPSDAAPSVAPGGRDAGAPLDLSTLSGTPPQPSAPMAAAAPVQASQPVPQPGASLPPPPSVPARNINASAGVPGAVQLATLPPTASAQDEYDLAYGYILHKDYALAEQAFRDFAKKYPNDRLVPDSQYWLGESLFQRQKYRDAAESFLSVSTKYEKSGKAPDSLLRLGQSLAALNQKEAACATLAEVARKFPRASAGVKRGVDQEQKRAHC